MPRPQSGPSFLQLPTDRPIIQRRYTASPPRHHEFTPPVAHGFIPLGTSTPLTTFMDHEGDSHRTDYFSLPLTLSERDGDSDVKESEKLGEAGSSPHTISYEPHGFIPLCSVAVVVRHEEAADYFSHAIPTKPQVDLQNLSPPGNDPADTSSPRFPGYLITANLPIGELRHQTGSPLLERDIVYSPDTACLASDLTSSGVRLRGGAVHDPQENLAEAERQRCESTGTSRRPNIKGTTSIVDQDHPFHEALARLELSGIQATMLNTLGLSISEYSGSEYSTNAEIFGDHGMDQDSIYQYEQLGEGQISLTEALALSNDALQQMAETMALPDGSDMADSEVDDNKNAEVSQAREADITIQSPGASGERDDKNSSRMQSIMEKEEPATQTSYSLDPDLTEPDTARSSPTQPRHTWQHTTIPSHSARENTLFKIALLSTSRSLAKCLSGPTLTITNGTTGEIYASHVPERMFLHFCGPAVIERLKPAYTSPSDAFFQNVIEMPSSAATPLAIARIIRYMKRICSATSHKVSGEMRIPHNMLDGLETIRACRILDLLADASRIEKLIAREWMCNTIFDTSSSTLSLIWSAYFGTFRESEIGDGIVWFVLHETQKDTHGLAEEMWILLEQDEFWTLKMRVREEVVGRCWRVESRAQFLDRCGMERERLVRRRERRERKEWERTERIERIRAANRREALGLGHESVASTSRAWEAPESWLADSGSADAKSKGAGHSLIDDKPLPLPPSGNQVQSDSSLQTSGDPGHGQQVDLVSALYADVARSVSRFNRPVVDREREVADILNPRLVPVPKKNRGTLGKILTALSG
ncbi:hypothetical protein BKA63DRAFT_575923 [Paraphoma chrysanthemicola]|nr:hypothetical protein BKA63DRAFT_575923 [Paraphoma chrysanthemicola]